jgi:hypothetical protein
MGNSEVDAAVGGRPDDPLRPALGGLRQAIDNTLKARLAAGAWEALQSVDSQSHKPVHQIQGPPPGGLIQVGSESLGDVLPCVLLLCSATALEVLHHPSHSREAVEETRRSPLFPAHAGHRALQELDRLLVIAPARHGLVKIRQEERAPGISVREGRGGL